MHRRRVPDRREPDLPDMRELRWHVSGDVPRHLPDAVRSEHVLVVQLHVQHLRDAVQPGHVPGHVPNLRDAVQPGNLRDVRDAVQPGDMCDLPDPVQSADMQDV